MWVNNMEDNWKKKKRNWNNVSALRTKLKYLAGARSAYCTAVKQDVINVKTKSYREYVPTFHKYKTMHNLTWQT